MVQICEQDAYAKMAKDYAGIGAEMDKIAKTKQKPHMDSIMKERELRPGDWEDRTLLMLNTINAQRKNRGEKRFF